MVYKINNYSLNYVVNLGEQYLTKEMKKLIEQADKLMKSEIIQKRFQTDKALMEAWEKSGNISQFELLEKQIALVSPQSFPKPLEDIAHTKEKYSVRYKIPTDGEQVAMVNKIKSQSKKIKALKIFGKMPDKDTMVKIIDDCRFKTTEKCNDSAVGRKIGKDSETAKRWIEKLGLSYYAYNPKHER